MNTTASDASAATTGTVTVTANPPLLPPTLSEIDLGTTTTTATTMITANNARHIFSGGVVHVGASASSSTVSPETKIA